MGQINIGTLIDTFLIKCCKCGKGYDIKDNLYEDNILICPHCGLKHKVDFTLFDKKIEKLKKVEKLNLAFYPSLGASRIADANRIDKSLADNGDVTGWVKTNDFILATRIYGSKGAYNYAYTLKWRNVTDSGSFAAVGATGEISYAADTVLVDGQALPTESKICSAQTNYTWQNGMENEGDNILPDSGTYSLADEKYTELQWALDCSAAHDNDVYEFALYTSSTSIGTCLASITTAIIVVPTVTTQNCIPIDTTSATGNGNITIIGGAYVTTRGFCYMEGTEGDPTTANSVVYDEGSFDIGAYTKTITGLTEGTNYRVRSYAINPAGTSYGNTVQFDWSNWLSPTGYVDSEGYWSAEYNAYDENTTTAANHNNPSVPPLSWSSYLEITISAMNCSKVRFWAYYSSTTINQISLDVYYSAGWHNIYEGAFTDRVWVEKEIGSTQTVTAMRVKFYNIDVATARTAYLYEADFWGVAAPTDNGYFMSDGEREELFSYFMNLVETFGYLINPT